MIDDAMSFVDMMQCAIPQPARGRFIFFTGDVVMRFIQKLHRSVKAAGAVYACIDWRMIVQVLAIINRSSLDFVDRTVDLFDGALLFFIHVMSRGEVLQMSARVPQVGERVQVSRMPSRFVGKSNRSAESDKKYDGGAVSCSFHSLLEGLSAE